MDISSIDGIMKALEGVFSVEDLKQIMKGSVEAENKKRVVDTTMSVGAFGAPWITAINAGGDRRDWFGNDRWHQIFHHLGVPFTPLSIARPGQEKANL
jgi:glutathione S-transferase kappa 1